ncbi:hypothetical protein VTN00DRAFT_2296 [Thermoascus crustaceus]|uniref:uncharacterized protein n=1 Tax=Thermoascus crustaceus TaxID=5088 RepID=UPI0037431853
MYRESRHKPRGRWWRLLAAEEPISGPTSSRRNGAPPRCFRLPSICGCDADVELRESQKRSDRRKPRGRSTAQTPDTNIEHCFDRENKIKKNQMANPDTLKCTTEDSKTEKQARKKSNRDTLGMIIRK